MVASPATPWDPTYEQEDGWTVHRYELATGNVLRIGARDIRRERTGVHANLAISLNWVTLAWSNFNIEKDEDRVRLSNSAFNHLDNKANALDVVEFPKPILKHALDLFCIGLWDEVVSCDVGGPMEGNPDIQPAQRILGDYVLRDAGTILFAPPGAGKSYTSMGWAVAMASGIDTVWPIHEVVTPLYINVERSAASMQGRLARVNRALGLPATSPIPFLNARGKSLSDIYEAAKRTIAKDQCTVVFYDSISRAGFGSMIQDDVANKTMDMLNALSPSWVALAHSPRGDESHAFGSQMFDAAADLTVQLRSQTSLDGLRTGVALEVCKANDIKKPPLFVHCFEWDDDGLRKLRRSMRGEFSELEATERMSVEEQVAELLKSVGAMAATDVADNLGRSRANISMLLNKSERFVQVKREGAKVLYGLRQ